tara:strand:+ start:1929 stop:2276 length:348 start_codon:yes stop_codon:yes gene_type:complete
MSRYSLKPKTEIETLYDDVAAGFYAGHCSAFFFMASPRNPDDHDKEVDIEGTGVKVCEYIKQYCDMEDPLTAAVYSRIIMDVNPRNVGFPMYLHWKLYNRTISNDSSEENKYEEE